MQKLGVAWYKREEYERLKKLFEDGDDLPETYDDWLKEANRVSRLLRREGFSIEKVYLDADVFSAWCAASGLAMNAEARARYSSDIASAKHSNRN